MSKVISRGKLDEQQFFLRDFQFTYTDEYVQMLIDQICVRDERIHRLEHALMSSRNFIQTTGADSYARSLYATIEELLDV